MMSPELRAGSSRIYCHATGTDAEEDELVDVEVRDSDAPWGSDLLDDLPDILVDRPEGVFVGALIGPATTTGQLTNPDPGGEVKGPDGESDEETAEIFFRVKDADGEIDSATVEVTAED